MIRQVHKSHLAKCIVDLFRDVLLRLVIPGEEGCEIYDGDGGGLG